VISIILDIFYRSLKEAWSPVLKLEIEQVNSEINPQFAQIADENDLVVLSRFEIDNSKDTFIDLVHPYASLKPIRDVLRSRVQTGDGNESSERAWHAELKDAAYESSLQMQVLLGHVQTTLHTLQHLRVGDVLYFKKPDSARVNISDIGVYEADVGVVDTQMAIQIKHSLDVTGEIETH
jgi:flagellar motor switch protein FliM